MNGATARLRWLVLRLIRAYQKTLSIDHGFAGRLVPQGGRCRFYPSCSEYGYQAIERFGLIAGGYCALRRVLRCHPFAAGGVDEVPKKVPRSTFARGILSRSRPAARERRDERSRMA